MAIIITVMTTIMITTIMTTAMIITIMTTAMITTITTMTAKRWTTASGPRELTRRA